MPSSPSHASCISRSISLRDQAHPEPMGRAHEHFHDDPGGVAGVYGIDEEFVQLQDLRAERLHVRESAVPGAGIVNCDRESGA